MKTSYCPEPGDVVWLTFNPTRGREQRGRRPALAVSPRAYNQRTGLCVVFPITGQVKGYPFEVLVPDGLGVQGAVLADQGGTRSWAERQAEFICHLPATVVQDVMARYLTLLPLTR